MSKGNWIMLDIFANQNGTFDCRSMGLERQLLHGRSIAQQ